jgi:hypothetical protein
MPDPNIGQLAATVFERVVTSKPIEQWAGSFALFKALGEKGFKSQEPGGRLIEADLEYAQNSTFKSYGEMEELDTTRVDVFDAARYEWKFHAGTVVFSDVEKLRAAGPEAKIDLVSAKVENGMNSHMANLNTAGFLDGTGNGGKDIEGLTKLISETPTTGTKGGINSASFTWWRNVAVSGAKTLSVFDNIRSAFTTCNMRCSRGGTKELPKSIITSRTVLEGYASTLQTYERYNMDPGNKMRGANGALDVGGGLMHAQAEIFYDEDCSPSDSAYFLNSDYLKFYHLKGAWMKAKAAVEPANQLSAIIRVFTFGNFGVSQLRRLGVVYDIT